MLFGAPGMVDVIQIAAITIESCAAICLGVYYGVFGQNLYVSDLLFTMVSYQVIVTVFVLIQLVLCFMLVWRLSGGLTLRFGLAVVPLIISLVGWVTLNTEYRALDGSTSAIHLWGTFVFIVGVALYMLFLLVCIQDYFFVPTSDTYHFVLAVVVLLLYLTTIVFISVFGWKFGHNESEGWIYEHAAFITMVIAHVFLFAIVSPDPRPKFGKPENGQFNIPCHMR